MDIDILEKIGTALGLLTGGAGLNYLVLWKTNKLKAKNEADTIGAEAAQKSFAVNRDQSEYLIEKLNQYQKEYYNLEDSYRERMKKLQNELIESQRQFTQEINKKCQEIVNLKSEIIYLKGIRCYRECKDRIKENPYKNGNNTNISQ